MSTALRPWPMKGIGRGFSLLGRAYIPWLLNAPSSCSCLFQVSSSTSGNTFFARRSPPTPETRCPRPSPAVGMVEVIAPCSGVLVLLTPKRGVLGFTSGKSLTTGSFLPFAEISAADSLVATGDRSRHRLSSTPVLRSPRYDGSHLGLGSLFLLKMKYSRASRT
jgi:hypothetical protein